MRQSLLCRHPRRSVMSKCYNVSSGDPELKYLSLFRIKDRRILKHAIDSRSKDYRLCSLLCGGNDGGGNFTFATTPDTHDSDRKLKALTILFIIIFTLFLTGCSTVPRTTAHYGKDCAPNFNIDVSKIPNAVPKVEPLSKYGNPSSYVVRGHRYYVLKSAIGYDQTGIASWYGMKFYKVRTSSGEMYNVAAMTAASKVLPLPTYVQVTNLKNHRQVIVKVNDRGPFHENRIIDLSYVAAVKLGVFPAGTALVEVKAIDPSHPEVVSNTPVLTPIAPTGQPEIYLQLGAFRDHTNAQNLETKIKTHTQYPVLIKSADKNGSPIYRVQIGPIPTVDNTDQLHDSLEQSGLGEPITIIQ